MGQTLTHGVYLPDEGERNCYSGLAANWQILDTSVGTIAEHTTALAGKAPLVHTHTKSDITDFPAYGNAAGTICEGNDSRLSDARTPVAHTHGKADITDLFNSVNEWTNTNTFSNTLKQVNSAITKGTIPQSDTTAFNVYWGGTGVSNLTNGLFVQRGIVYADGSTAYILYTLENLSGGTHTSLSLRYNPNDTINPRYAFMRGDFRPYYDNSFNLGIPTYRWKTLNGINPGALSLPSGGTTENTDWYNVAGDILPTGGNATDFNWGQNYFTPSKDGWLALTIQQCSSISVWCDTLKYGMSVAAPDATLNRQLLIPVVANIAYEIRISGNSWFSARLIMPKGNV